MWFGGTIKVTMLNNKNTKDIIFSWFGGRNTTDISFPGLVSATLFSGLFGRRFSWVDNEIIDIYYPFPLNKTFAPKGVFLIWILAINKKREKESPYIHRRGTSREVRVNNTDWKN